MCICNSLNGQNEYISMVEENKYWIYYDFTGRPRPTTGFVVTIKGDTIVSGIGYKKVYRYQLKGYLETNPVNEPPHFVSNYPYELAGKELISLIREDVSTKQVFNRPVIKNAPCMDDLATYEYECNEVIFCDSLEHLLFDFNLVKEDTLNFCAYVPMSYSWVITPRVIDSTTYEMYFNKTRKTFYTYGIPSYLQNLQNPGPIPEGKVKILEGVGFLYQGIFHYRFGILKDFCEGTLAQCNIISATSDPQNNTLQKLSVYPNPAFEKINLVTEIDTKKIEIYDQYARFVEAYKEKEINVSHLPSGMYYMKVTDENDRIANCRFVKI